MSLIPKNWTHHHKHRVFHMVMLTHTLLMVGIIFCAIGILSWRAHGESGSVAISAEVEVINDAPTVVEPESSGGGYFPALPTTEDPELLPEDSTVDNKEPLIDVVVESKELEDIAALKEGKPSTIQVPGIGRVPLYHSTRPTFSGRTNIPFAWIYLEIHSLVIKATTRADAEGYWSWDSTENLEQGPHKIYITSVDPENDSVRATTERAFYITAPSAVSSKIPQNTPDVGNNGTLFDVFVSIPTQFKTIAAGEDIIAKIRLVNFGKAGSPVDVGVQYIIENQDGVVIRQSSETVAVATQISLLKTFFYFAIPSTRSL